MARIFRTLLIAAVNAIKEFLAFATKGCLEDSLVNITNVNCTDLGNFIYQGNGTAYLITNEVIKTQDVDSWAIYLCYTHNTNLNDFNAIIGQANQDHSGMTLNVRSNGNVQVNMQQTGTSWIFADQNVGLTVQQNHTYYMILGYDNSNQQYYFKYSEVDFETAEEATPWTYNSTVKNYQIDPLCFLGSKFWSGRYNTGKLDLSKSKIILDNKTIIFTYFEIQEGDNVKLNDGMATSNYDWSAYQLYDTNNTGEFTATGTVEKIKEINGETVYVTAEPEQDNKDVNIKAGKVYYAYTNENYDLVNAEVVGTLTENNGIYSGFSTTEYGSASSSNYIHYTLNKTYSSINKLEIVFKVKTGNSFAGSGRIFNSTGQGSDIFVVGCSSSEAWLRINDSQYKGVTIYTTFNTNTNYWFKYTYNDNNDGTYKGYYSTDGINWSEPVVQSNPQVASISVTSFDIGTRVGTVVCDWKGSIDLTKSYMKINDDTYNFCVLTTSESVYTTDNPIHTGFKEWAQPTLSANGTLGGDSFAVSLTNEYSSTYAAWKAFDNNSGSCFWTSVIPADLIIYNPVPLNVTALHWEVYDYNRRPTSWEWYGSNDNETYTLISSGTNNSDDFTLNFTPSVAYKYHKFKVLSAYNQLNAKQITLTAKEQITPSILYNSNFQPLDPQPEFTVQDVGLLNAKVVGTLTNNNGIYSGFSDTNYISCDNFLNNTQGSFEVKSKIYLTGASTANCSIIDTSQENSTSAFRFEVNSSMKLQCRLSNTIGSYEYFATLIGTTTLQLNTWYFVKVTYNSSTGYALYLTQDESNWHDPEATTSNTSMINHTQQTLFIGDNVTTNSSLPGYIDLTKTSITINGIEYRLYASVVGILINDDLYERNITDDKIKDIQGVTPVISTVDNTTIYNLTLKTPTIGYNDILYYAYTNENDSEDSLYTTDNPISKGDFIFNSNTSNTNCVNLGNGIYQGGNNRYITYTDNNNITLQYGWRFRSYIQYYGGGTYATVTGGNTPNYNWFTFPCFSFNNNYVRLTMSLNGTSGAIIDGNIGAMPVVSGQWYYIEFGATKSGSNFTYYAKYNQTGFDDRTDNYNWSTTTSSQAYYAGTGIMLMNGIGDSQHFNNGCIDMTKTSFEYKVTSIEDDFTTIAFGELGNPSILYEHTGENEFTALDPQPEFTIKNASVTNASVIGTLTNNNGIYSGFSNSNYLLMDSSLSDNISAADLIFKANLTSLTTHSILLARQSNTEQYFGIRNNKKFAIYNSGWTDGTNELNVNTWYWFRVIFNGTNWIGYTLEDNNYTSSTLPEISQWRQEWTTASNGAASWIKGVRCTIGNNLFVDSEYLYGSIDMSNTSITIDGQTTNFYNASSGIIIDNTLYARTENDDLYKRIYEDAIINASTNITNFNNELITSGKYVYLNLTVPSSLTAIIQSAGQTVSASDFPMLVEKNDGVGLLLKDGNSVVYRNSWVAGKDRDLHYQKLVFTTNVQNPTIVVKVNNVVLPYPYIVYNGDNYIYTISKEGYVDYNGSGTVSYTSKDNNEIAINVELAVSNGTVDTTDYKYTIDNLGNMVITGYVGSNTDTTVPNIAENL